MSTNTLLSKQLKSLLLPVMRSEFENQAERARKEGLSYEEYLADLTEAELEERRNKRFARWLKESGISPIKTLSNLDMERFPKGIFHQFKALLEGKFIEKKENVLFFGTPGGGKTLGSRDDPQGL